MNLENWLNQLALPADSFIYNSDHVVVGSEEFYYDDYENERELINDIIDHLDLDETYFG